MPETETMSPVVGPSAETPDVTPPVDRGGRRSHAYYHTPVQQIITETAPRAARILAEHLEGRRDRKTLVAGMKEICMYFIDHAIGKPRQKIEHSGAVLTYGEVAKSAEGLETKARPVLADSESIAGLLPAGQVIDVEPAESKLSDVD